MNQVLGVAIILAICVCREWNKCGLCGWIEWIDCVDRLCGGERDGIINVDYVNGLCGLCE
jgi:hypothetical protein